MAAFGSVLRLGWSTELAGVCHLRSRAGDLWVMKQIFREVFACPHSMAVTIFITIFSCFFLSVFAAPKHQGCPCQAKEHTQCQGTRAHTHSSKGGEGLPFCLTPAEEALPKFFSLDGCVSASLPQLLVLWPRVSHPFDPLQIRFSSMPFHRDTELPAGGWHCSLAAAGVGGILYHTEAPLHSFLGQSPWSQLLRHSFQEKRQLDLC